MSKNTKIEEIITELNTNNPFEAVLKYDIIVLYENLGSIKGYFNVVTGDNGEKIKFIHLNEKLEGREKEIIMAHELGHALLHENEGNSILLDHTLISFGKLENEANKFAIELLINNEELKNCLECGYNKDQIASYFGVPIDMLEYKSFPDIEKCYY